MYSLRRQGNGSMIQEMFPVPSGFFSSYSTTLETSKSDFNQSQNGKQQIS